MLFLFAAGDGEAAILDARTCGAADVQAAVNASTAGDTVRLPAGTCTWATRVLITKGIVLIGAGIDTTVLVDNVTKNGTNESQLLRFEVNAPEAFRLAYMSISGQATDPNVYNKGHLGLAGSAKRFRVDHVKFTNQATSAIRIEGDLWGLIDHCEFVYTFKNAVVVGHGSWGGRDYGDGSWAEPLGLGSEKAVYIEDCVCTELYSSTPSCVDAFDGARIVVRYNTLNNTTIASHGTESSQRRRGMRSFEVYGNTFNSTGLYDRAVYVRSGTGVVFDNVINGQWNHAVKMDNYRDSSSYTPWGKCDGSSPYDQNAQGGYRCVDQPGAGTSALLNGDVPNPAWVGNTLDPIYTWNNTGRWNFAVAGGSANVQENRDYYVGTPRPGYTPYTYPHPLQSDRPAAPTGVRIIR